MNWFKKAKEEKWFPYTVAISIGVILAFLLYNLPIIGAILLGIWHVMKPVFLGVIFAYVLDPIVRFFEHKVFSKMRKRMLARHFGIYLAIIITLAGLTLLVVAFIPPLYNSIWSVINTLSGSTQILQNLFTMKSVVIFGKEYSFDIVNDMAAPIWNKISESGIGLESILAKSFDVGNNLLSVILGFILAIYFLLDKNRVKEIAKSVIRYILKQEKYESFMGFCVKCDKILIKYISCEVLEGIFVGVANAIFMAIVGMPYISLISVIVGVTNLAPTFGPIIGGAIGGLLLLLVNPWYALWFIIFTVIIQTVDGYIVKPKLFGDSLGISPLLILVAIIVGGRLFGAIGILLAIPAAAILYCFVVDYLLAGKKDSGKDA